MSKRTPIVLWRGFVAAALSVIGVWLSLYQPDLYGSICVDPAQIDLHLTPAPGQI